MKRSHIIKLRSLLGEFRSAYWGYESAPEMDMVDERIEEVLQDKDYDL